MPRGGCRKEKIVVRELKDVRGEPEVEEAFVEAVGEMFEFCCNY